MQPVRIGTCGWSYKEWVGPFYPKGLKAGNFLTAYAERHAVVEVDSTFYRTPSHRMVEGWREKTPAGFGFSLKVPQIITHEKALVDCRAEVSEFLGAVRLLEDKLVCCLLQFGFFNRQVISTLKVFLERLDPFLAAWPRDVPVAVEIRNKSWVTAELADCLRRHGAVWALADQTWMPAPTEILERCDSVTGPFGYLRLLGDRAEVEARTKLFDHVVVDRTAQIQADAQAIQQLRQRVPVLAFVNNHFAGYAPATIRQLRAELGMPELEHAPALPPAAKPRRKSGPQLPFDADIA